MGSRERKLNAMDLGAVLTMDDLEVRLKAMCEQLLVLDGVKTFQVGYQKALDVLTSSFKEKVNNTILAMKGKGIMTIFHSLLAPLY